MSLVSVIIPAYNAERYLPMALASVQAQTTQDWECIVVDDGSRDGTYALACELASADDRVRAIRKENGGVGSARNAGAREARSELLLCLDSDDALQPDALSVLLDALESHADWDAAHGVARYMDADGSPCRLGEAEAWTRSRREVRAGKMAECGPDAPTSFGALAYRNYIITPGSALIRTEAFHRIGGCDEALRNAEDYNFWLRLAARGTIGFVDRVVVDYRLHGNNKSRDKAIMERREAIARGRVLAVCELTPEQQRILRTGYRLKQRSDVRDKVSFATEALAGGNVIRAGRELLRAAKIAVRSVRGMPGWALRETR